MSEAHLVEQAEVALKGIETTDDPLRRQALCAEYNMLVDKLDLLHVQRNRTFVLLPTELKYNIFEIVVASNPYGPLLLAQVCKEWHTFVYQTAALWTNLTIDIHKRSFFNVEKFSIQSKERLLDVTIHAPISPHAVDVIASLRNCHRWRSLTIIGDIFTRSLGSQMFIFLFRVDPFQNLSTIDVQLSHHNSKPTPIWSYLIPEDKISDVRSDRARIALLSHLTINMSFTTLDGIRSILSLHPNLKYLELAGHSGSSLDLSLLADRSTIPLHQLRELQMNYDHSDILMVIECPKIEVLTVSATPQKLPELHAKLRACGCLQQLTIRVLSPGSRSELSSIPTISSQIPLAHLTVDHTCFQDGEGDLELVYAILWLFPLARNVEISTNSVHFDWPGVISRFRQAGYLSFGLRDRFSPFFPMPIPSLSSQMSQFSHLPCLTTLQVTGGICDMVLSVISTPKIHSLILRESRNLSPDTLFSFLRRSPMLYTMSLDHIQTAAQLSTNVLQASAITTQIGSVIPCSIEELRTNHGVIPILPQLSLPNLRRLHLKEVISHIEFDPPGMNLLNLIEFTPHLLERITTLDTCSEDGVSQLLIGLVDILPHLRGLECLALPRPPLKNDIIIDAVVQRMRKFGQEDVPACPNLKTLKTRCYPEWEGLLELLLERNRVAHIPEKHRSTLPVPLECIILPALPHPSILERVQLALAGKYPPQGTLEIAGNVDRRIGCDSCPLSGWPCDQRRYASDSELFLVCDRHHWGSVRITAYS